MLCKELKRGGDYLTNIASNSSKDLPLVSGKNLRIIISPINANPP